MIPGYQIDTVLVLRLIISFWNDEDNNIFSGMSHDTRQIHSLKTRNDLGIGLWKNLLCGVDFLYTICQIQSETFIFWRALISIEHNGALFKSSRHLLPNFPSSTIFYFQNLLLILTPKWEPKVCSFCFKTTLETIIIKRIKVECL